MIALVPSLTLLLLGAGTAGHLVIQGNSARQWAAQTRSLMPAAREFLEAIQEERQSTLAALGGDETSRPTLAPARARLDSAFKGLMAASTGALAVGNSKIGATANGFVALDTQLTRIRLATDMDRLSVPDAYAFYNQLLDSIAQGSKVVARTAPDAAIGAQFSDGMRIFLAEEAMSRSDALAGTIVAATGPLPIPLQEFVYQIGFYHAEIANLAADLDPQQQKTLHGLVTSQAWQQLTSMENALVQRNKQSSPLPLSIAEWHSAATEVNRGLIDVWLTQYAQAQQLAEAEATDDTAESAYAGGGVAAVSLLAFLIAVLLANRIIRRLTRLRDEALHLADERLPEMMRRLQDGEVIDPAAESPDLDYGADEVGQVAKAFQRAHAAAVNGAVNEAKTREGVRAVFLNIAHRSQTVMHRQLEILDKAEARQEDPAMLDILFQLDHLATRERRNAENLIILGGGQPGRQWRNSVPLIDVVRSAVGETVDYPRVRLSRLPETRVLGFVVADLIHLLAELVDNATSFSPPQSRVDITGSVAGKGVVTTISDQGMGITKDEMDRINEILRQPPNFGVATLSADSRLGLFVVAKLAAGHGVSVRIAESDYGGIRAVVLIPSALLSIESPSVVTDSVSMESASPPRLSALRERSAERTRDIMSAIESGDAAK